VRECPQNEQLGILWSAVSGAADDPRILSGRSDSFGKLGINLVSELLASGASVGTLKWDNPVSRSDEVESKPFSPIVMLNNDSNQRDLFGRIMRSRLWPDLHN
jgi:hypothetical protein